jgi:hypothetical protein
MLDQAVMCLTSIHVLAQDVPFQSFPQDECQELGHGYFCFQFAIYNHPVTSSSTKQLYLYLAYNSGMQKCSHTSVFNK